MTSKGLEIVTDRSSDHQPVHSVRAFRIATGDENRPAVEEDCALTVETAVAIDVSGVDVYTILCTPTDTDALALGFLLTEGLIDSRDDVTFLGPCPDTPGLVRVNLRDPSKAQGARRNLRIVSSCGLCGREHIEELLAGLPRVEDTLRLPAARLREMLEALREHQALFSETGGAHAAAIFTAAGDMVGFSEDLGRHTALDKAIGRCLLEGRATAGCGVALSGRVSLEMVVKCARAGMELMAAVSAPTSLAVEAAAQCGITVCAFVRETRATLFSCPHRIAGL